MTKTQTEAIEFIKRTITDHLTAHAREKYGAQITKCEVKQSEYALWLSIETEYTTLPEDNVLRAVSHEFWFFELGKRGAITAHIYPKSLNQFKGRKAFGFNIK